MNLLYYIFNVLKYVIVGLTIILMFTVMFELSIFNYIFMLLILFYSLFILFIVISIYSINKKYTCKYCKHHNSINYNDILELKNITDNYCTNCGKPFKEIIYEK